jgi:hypothetical protein
MNTSADMYRSAVVDLDFQDKPSFNVRFLTNFLFSLESQLTRSISLRIQYCIFWEVPYLRW